MAKYNPRLSKINRTYTVEDVAELYHCHKNTVCNWTKNGLIVCVPTRPKLIHGSDLRLFLEAKYKKRKRTCKPGQIYCVACKEPRHPKDQFAILIRLDSQVGDLIGECPDCCHTIHRKVSLSRIDTWQGNLLIT